MENLVPTSMEIVDDSNPDILYWAYHQLKALVRKGDIDRDQLVQRMNDLRM